MTVYDTLARRNEESRSATSNPLPRLGRPPLLGAPIDASARRWIIGVCLFCAFSIALMSWVSRFAMNPDGISYLDMADQLLKGDLTPLVHPYWSPLYPCVLALALRTFSPPPPSEVLVVHLVNFFIGLLALAGFTFFLIQWARLRPAGPNPDDSVAAFRLRTGFAYVLFLWGTIEMTGLANVTPDLCVAAEVYLISGLCCRLQAPVVDGAQPYCWALPWAWATSPKLR